MSRVLFFTLLVAGVSATAFAQVDVAPAPRLIRPDGTRDPAPQPEQAKKVNPLEVVERIITNSKAVGDKLAMTDTGTETRAKQETILKDIQSLIDQQEDPSPQSSSDQSKSDQDKQKSDSSDKKSDMMPMGGMDMSPMKNDSQGGKSGQGGMGGQGGKGGMKEQAMSDHDDQPKGRRPRQQGGEPKEKDNQPKDKDAGMSNTGNMQQQTKNSTPPKDPKNASAGRPDPIGDPKTPGQPSLPPEVEMVKEVWGHLPDKLRQQATQYYQQEFMPRYAELLKHYYSSLAEKNGKK